MLSIVDVAAPIPPVFAATTGSELYERFESDPEIMTVAVVDERTVPIGLISRLHFMLKMGSHYGRPLYGGRSVTLLMDASPMTVDHLTPISAFTGEVLALNSSDQLNGFIVVPHTTMT